MKNFAIIFVALTSFAAFASPLASKALEGNFSLVDERDGLNGRLCPQSIEIRISEKAVYANVDGNFLDYFDTAHEGCTSRVGDIGPWDKRCVAFSKNSITESRTQPVTLIGYIREARSLKLSNKGKKLVYKKSTTAIPLGFMEMFHDSDFKCTYERN